MTHVQPDHRSVSYFLSFPIERDGPARKAFDHLRSRLTAPAEPQSPPDLPGSFDDAASFAEADLALYRQEDFEHASAGLRLLFGLIMGVTMVATGHFFTESLKARHLNKWLIPSASASIVMMILAWLL